jgi:hypothetical protein
MRKGWLTVAVVSVFGLGWSAGQVFSQDAPAPKKEEPAKEGEKPAAGPSQEEMEAWMKYMTPGEQHKKMAAMDGEWTVASKMWMDPKAPPTDGTGTAKFRMILGGRYQVQEYSGNFMGMPFDGMGISGFDNASKEHVSCWIDSMSTGMMASKGTEDASGKVTLNGEFVNPTGQVEKMRMVMVHVDKDNFRLEAFVKSPKSPEEVKCMELNYTRKGGAVSTPK